MSNKLKSNLPLIVIGFICILLIVLFAASRLATAQKEEKSAQYAITEMNSAADVAKFLTEYGWEVRDEPSAVKSVRIPAEFDAVYNKYNQLQILQNFDLTEYRTKTAVMYTFRILNHVSHNNVFANVLVYEGNVIAGDVISYAIDGFITGLDGQYMPELIT
ncbi:MAG: DUF4830 domain-containing protein [Oscillospiraceae bacterium]|nr:DUF4830 domain-containing protein [Oscillospiraceae bacterium]